jgi:Skp family chaperone for outer membrane proteins
LMALRAELGLADEEAEAIEAEILKPHREYQRKQQEYQETLRQCLERESPLSSRTIDDLRDYRAHLQLKPEDVTSIEQAALNGKTLEGYVAELERQWQAQAQQQAEAERQQREAKAERKRQAQAQHQRQEEKARYSKPQPSTVLPSAPPSPPRPITGGTLMSRQQFLKWGGLSSVGLIVAFWISQALRDSPSSSTVTVNPTTSVNPPVENIPASQVDYGQLKALLKAGQWQKADEETRKVMLKIAGRESKGWLDTASIKNFPCGALGTIDQLWVEASG